MKHSLVRLLATSLLLGVSAMLLHADAPAPTAKALDLDAKTKGAWVKTYGLKGYALFGLKDPAKPEAEMVNLMTEKDGLLKSLTPVDCQAKVWLDTTEEARATQLPGGEKKAAACYTNEKAMTIKMSPRDAAKPYQISLYCLDWDSNDRAQKIDVQNPATGASLLDKPLEMSKFHDGAWARFTCCGEVNIVVTRTEGAGAVISALTVDEVPAAK